MDYWGKYMYFNLRKCNDNMKDEITVGKFLKDLVYNIHMKPYGDPIVVRFATHDINKGGITGIQMLEDSSVTMHCVDFNNNVYLDIFSCCDFKKSEAFEVIDDYFKPEAYSWDEILRNVP